MSGTTLEEYKKELAWLNAIIPKASGSLCEQCLSSAEAMRQKIYLYQRANIILPIAYSTTYPADLLPERADIMRAIMSQKVMTAQEVTPCFIQHSAMAIQYLYQNIPKLCKVALTKTFKPEYRHFIIYSVIPSLFGYFTSMEHCRYATQFYLEIVKTAKFEDACAFLHPFLTSGITFRFIEAIMQPFLIKFGSEKKIFILDKKKKIDGYVLNSFKHQLTRLIKDAVPLLPVQVIELFQAMKAAKWSKSKFNDLFFGDKFMGYLALLWMNSSPFAHQSATFRMIMDLVKDSGEINLNLFTNVNQRFELPSCYEGFKVPHMLYCMTVADVRVAIQMAMEFGELPMALRDVDYEFLPKSKWFKMFWVRMFPKGAKPKPAPFKHLVFNCRRVDVEPNKDYERMYLRLRETKDYRMTAIDPAFDDYVVRRELNDAAKQSEIFEDLITFRMQASLVKMYENLVCSHDFMASANLAIKCAITARDTYPTLQEAFSKASERFKSNEVRKIQFFVVYGRVVTEAASKLDKELKELDQGFSKLLAKFQQSFNPSALNKLPRASSMLFWQAIELLQSIHFIPITRQISQIIELLRTIRQIAHDQQEFELIMEHATIMANGFVLPSRFLLYNEIVVKDHNFKPLLETQDEKMWAWFEAFILKFTALKSEPLHLLLLATQEAIVNHLQQSTLYNQQ